MKIIRSENYNFNFDEKTGFFQRWGKTKQDDPDTSPFGPEILDLEISSGHCSASCAFCYKENNSDKSSQNMTLGQCQILLSKFNLDALTQIAFGICDIHTNPYMWDIFRHCRDKGIIPNYTCNGLFVDEAIANKTKALCGAVAVSIVDKEESFKAINHFTSISMDTKIYVKKIS